MQSTISSCRKKQLKSCAAVCFYDVCNLIKATNVKYFFVDNIFSGKTASHKDNGGSSYFGRLKWIPIPVTVGFAYIGYQQYRHIRKREERKLNTVSDPEELLANDWTVRSFFLILFFALNKLKIPETRTVYIDSVWRR